jgi:hypothetical protein
MDEARLREAAEKIAGLLAGTLVNAFARGVPLVVTDGAGWRLDGQAIAKQIRPMLTGECEDLLRETVEECAEVAEWASRSGVTNTHGLIRERFKWLGGGD